MISSQSGEVAGPFSNHLEGMILASLEDGESEFFLSGLDLVVSSVTDMQFPTPHLIQVIRNKLLQVSRIFSSYDSIKPYMGNGLEALKKII